MFPGLTSSLVLCSGLFFLLPWYLFISGCFTSLSPLIHFFFMSFLFSQPNLFLFTLMWFGITYLWYFSFPYTSFCSLSQWFSWFVFVVLSLHLLCVNKRKGEVTWNWRDRERGWEKLQNWQMGDYGRLGQGKTGSWREKKRKEFSL